MPQFRSTRVPIANVELTSASTRMRGFNSDPQRACASSVVGIVGSYAMLRGIFCVVIRTTAGSLLTVAALLGGSAAACNRSGQAAAGPPPGAPPVAVGITVVQPKPVDRTSEYVATLRSRRTSDIRPQVEGIVTRIFVRSGDRVTAGARLAQVDPLKQEATVSSNAASRAAQEAQLQLAREEFQRQKALFDQGLVSRQVLDQASAAVGTAEASLKALAAREQESRVELQYYQVTAPTDGVVGDIPVRVGDRVKTDTLITTISDNAGLEAYIYVPIERASELKSGLPVRLVDSQAKVLAATRVDFVSPQVDDNTQSVLAKAPVPSNRGFRTEQFVRAQIVWSTDRALTVPVTAVTRINGQYFAYVAEQGQNGLVAKAAPPDGRRVPDR
jgi:RND family efflux transporter MFP subunit